MTRRINIARHLLALPFDIAATALHHLAQKIRPKRERHVL